MDTSKRLLSTGKCDQMGFKEGVREMSSEEILFLDSTGLKDLPKLLDDVQVSANHVLMLSRHTLERPWVLAELCAARKEKKNICVVLVEYPGKESNSKQFRFPLDLETAITEWKEYTISEYEQAMRKHRRRSLVGAKVVGRLKRKPKRVRAPSDAKGANRSPPIALVRTSTIFCSRAKHLTHFEMRRSKSKRPSLHQVVSDLDRRSVTESRQ